MFVFFYVSSCVCVSVCWRWVDYDVHGAYLFFYFGLCVGFIDLISCFCLMFVCVKICAVDEILHCLYLLFFYHIFHSVNKSVYVFYFCSLHVWVFVLSLSVHTWV